MSDKPQPGTGHREGLVHAEVPGDRLLTAIDLWRIPRVGAPCACPVMERLVVPVTTWPGDMRSKLTRLWLVSPEGTACRPLTGDHGSAGAPAWSPDGKQLAYTWKPNADEKARPQLRLLPLDGGESEALTDLPLGVLDARWLPDGSGLVIAAKLLAGHATVEATRAEADRREQDPVQAHATEERLFRYWDQWLTDGAQPHFFHLDLASRVLRDLTPQANAWLSFMDPTGQFDMAPDGSEFVFAGLVADEEKNEVESRIFRVALSGGEIECLTPDAPAGCSRPRYAPDGKTIVYGRTEDRYFYADRPRLYRIDRSNGSHAPWCDDWDQAPSDWEFAPDGALLFVAEHAARTHLYQLAADEATPRLVAQGGSIGSPCIGAGGTVYCTWQNLQQPPEVHRCDLSRQQTERLTRFTDEALAGVRFGVVQEIECEGAEGERIQSFVVLPPGHDAGHPAPLVNVIHGGPHGVWGDAFHFRWSAQLFAAAGYVVALPNFQGSTSWGNDFAQRIQGEWGKRPFEDVMAVTDHLIERGLVDSQRMAAIGGSYGGYLVSWIAGHTDRFRCIVNHAGVYNTLSMFASDVTWGRGRSIGGEPWSGLEGIDRYNPARFTADMNTPMLVIHGDKDYRVPVTQGLECYGVLQAKGVPCRLLHFPDENHWILKPHNSLRWYQEVQDWIDRWLAD
ncbi:alpha/beta hydrolase family protein [Lignipirellula cremea]|uniref:Prolyl tripeptidyl peptidase n=1 Tax=Lignipirellula cremea TaxID=2528010 RepID=A0A518E4J0_9BACT|nr:S9 family peptidase [Lignipirellula cremea]QDU98983.1 Prolyl tripeptidyl peptidase precursor [Lignipirellula cremea]